MPSRSQGRSLYVRCTLLLPFRLDVGHRAHRRRAVRRRQVVAGGPGAGGQHEDRRRARVPEVDRTEAAAPASAGSRPAQLANTAGATDVRGGIGRRDDGRVLLRRSASGRKHANGAFISSGETEVCQGRALRHCRRSCKRSPSLSRTTHGLPPRRTRQVPSWLAHRKRRRSLLRLQVGSRNSCRTPPGADRARSGATSVSREEAPGPGDVVACRMFHDPMRVAA